MYKDKNKQREAARERAKRYRNAHKQSVTPEVESITPVTPSVIPSVTPKRGIDIQCFADLPVDVQADIERYSRACTVEGHEYSREQDRQARTARAIRYQHLFPDRYHPRGIAV